MSYWVYENWTVKKARIHKSDCPLHSRVPKRVPLSTNFVNLHE
jgi:hypothetical protein